MAFDLAERIREQPAFQLNILANDINVRRPIGTITFEAQLCIDDARGPHTIPIGLPLLRQGRVESIVQLQIIGSYLNMHWGFGVKAVDDCVEGTVGLATLAFTSRNCNDWLSQKNLPLKLSRGYGSRRSLRCPFRAYRPLEISRVR